MAFFVFDHENLGISLLYVIWDCGLFSKIFFALIAVALFEMKKFDVLCKIKIKFN